MTRNAEMPKRAYQIPPGNSLGRFHRYISLVHSDAEIDGTLGAVEDTLEGPRARP